MVPQIGMPQGWELILIVLVILLLFGARKLPELARGSGQALRIFKSETKGLKEGDSREGTDTARQPSEERQVESGATSDTERVRQERTDGTSA